jgi:hypothetical protein
MNADFTPGYPIDLRSSEQRIRASQGPVGDFEGIAARVVARLTGERVVIQDDGSRSSMPDIRIDYAAKPAAYVEVVVDIDPSYAAMDAAIFKGIHTLPCDRIWWVHLTGRANVNAMRRILPSMLDTDVLSQETSQQLADMGVESIDGPATPRPGEPGGINLVPAGVRGSAAPVWPAFLDWLADVLASSKTADVRTKLAATNAPERHAFIAASFSTDGDVFFALAQEGHPELPASDPVLPPEITHLWVGSIPSIGRCLAWFPDTGWIDVVDHWATA